MVWCIFVACSCTLSLAVCYFSPEILHGLRASPFWNADEIPWAAYMQDAFETIRTEFMAAKKSTRINPFQPYRSPKSPGSTKQSDLLGEFATDTGDWNVCYLHLHGIDFDDNLEIFPNTSQAIKSVRFSSQF